MDELRIYCLYNSERDNFEIPAKGWRQDIHVLKAGKYFRLFIYDIVRLQQSFEMDVAQNGYFSIDPNIVIVPKVTFDNIRSTVRGLDREKYFDYIKPLNKAEIDIASLIEI